MDRENLQRTYLFSIFSGFAENHTLLTSVTLSLSFPLSETEFPEEMDPVSS